MEALIQWAWRKFLPLLIGALILSAMLAGLTSKAHHVSNPFYGDDREYYQDK
ncbi:hypothetical protein [Ferruginibacter albus]|uniref:hypothetical protein n=1 Tax=Ferruginibacter albus TaxID=2875540 RepID=UPI001CC59999|nr:hypothetical protein [Ferruginibacter albus]UAY53426.1 hypothetical protein K9M53_07070 [Ferruginibacter albus]